MNTQRRSCFVVGPIGSPGSSERKQADLLLREIIKPAVEIGERGFEVRRADLDPYPGMLSDRIISDIVHSELVIADLTGLNPNVFYELGIRHAVQKPVIPVALSGTILPFDNIAVRTIFVDLGDWNSKENARADLRAAAELIDEDYVVSNPITQAESSFKFRASADPESRLVAQLSDRVRALEAQIKLGFHGSQRQALQTPFIANHFERLTDILRHDAPGVLEISFSPDSVGAEDVANALATAFRDASWHIKGPESDDPKLKSERQGIVIFASRIYESRTGDWVEEALKRAGISFRKEYVGDCNPFIHVYSA